MTRKEILEKTIDFDDAINRIVRLEEENAENESEARELNIRIDGLIKENAELKKRNAELKGMYAHSAREAGTYKQFLEAKEKENAELKTGIALKDEEMGCIETDFNTFKSQAKDLLKQWVELYKPKLEGYPITPIQEQTEQFLKK